MERKFTRRIAGVSLNFVGIFKSSHNFIIPDLNSSLETSKKKFFKNIKIEIYLQSIVSNGFPF
jgi:hypothetical protein